MAIKLTGKLTINDIVAEFGNTGSRPYKLADYYRGGSLVPDIPANAKIPTSGANKVSNYYGASKT